MNNEQGAIDLRQLIANELGLPLDMIGVVIGVNLLIIAVDQPYTLVPTEKARVRDSIQASTGYFKNVRFL